MTQRYWFRQKKFGYGATPNTWQGWVVVIASSALVIGLVVVPSVLITHAKTEGGWRWRWGSKDG